MVGAPNYVKRANIANNTSLPQSYEVTFKSGHVGSYSLDAFESKDIERSVEESTWTKVDPITKIGTQDVSDRENGVEILYFVHRAEGLVLI